MMIAGCVMEDLDLFNPFTGQPLRKEQMGFIVVWVDFIVVISLCIFIWIIEYTQKKYVD